MIEGHVIILLILMKTGGLGFDDLKNLIQKDAKEISPWGKKISDVILHGELTKMMTANMVFMDHEIYKITGTGEETVFKDYYVIFSGKYVPQ